MSKPLIDKRVYRIIDANLNRAKEGLRVVEEIARFVLEDRALAMKLKSLRHALDKLALRISTLKNRLQQRDSLKDVGYKLHSLELNRSGLKDILYANIQRAKESIRVLEEFGKLKDKKAALAFKKLRYRLYEIEKNTHL